MKLGQSGSATQPDKPRALGAVNIKPAGMSTNNTATGTANNNDNGELENCLTAIATKRDKQAFAVLFKHFAPKIKRVAVSKLSTEALAMEVVQETLTIIWRKAHLYHPDKGSANTWIYTIMRNVIFDTLRKLNSRQKECLSEDLWPLAEPLTDQTLEEPDFRDHLMDEKLHKMVEQLPANQQAVIRAVYFQELTQEQLALQLNIPLGTVKSRLRLALAKLKQQLGGQHD